MSSSGWFSKRVSQKAQVKIRHWVKPTNINLKYRKIHRIILPPFAGSKAFSFIIFQRLAEMTFNFIKPKVQNSNYTCTIIRASMIDFKMQLEALFL